MAQLRQDYAQFVARDAEVIVISPEDMPEVAKFWGAESMPMPGLADPGHEVANRYGQEVNLLKLGRMPSLIILDHAGRVRYEHRANNMADIPDNRKLLAALDELNREAAPAR
jgi:peroxiredoxin